MITLLGIGNILLKDEGLGSHFINWFKERHDLGSQVNVLDGGTLGFLLLDQICQSDLLLVVDAMKTEAKPGSIFRFALDEIPPEFHSQGTVHDITFLQVMLHAEIMDEAPKECVFIGVVPEDITGSGVGVTPAIEQKFPEIETLVLKELKRWGVSQIPKEAINS